MTAPTAREAGEVEPYGHYFTDDPAKFAMPGSGFKLGPVPPDHCVSVTPVYAQSAIDTLRGQLEAAEADAVRARSQREHTWQWYAVRMAKIEDIAKREGLWNEVAAVFANGSATRRLPDGSYFYDPPTYAQQLNSAKHRAAAAEARAEAAEAKVACMESYQFDQNQEIDALLDIWQSHFVSGVRPDADEPEEQELWDRIQSIRDEIARTKEAAP